MAGKLRVRNFNINNSDDREACEEVLTKYTPLGSIKKHETYYDKSGTYFVALHWEEEEDEEEYRD